MLVAIGAAGPAFVATSLVAQVRGIVTGASGRPLGAVVVELWRDGSPIGSRVTDTTGLFGFPASEARRATELSARRIGFTARRVRLERGDSVLRIALLGMSNAPTTAALERIRASCPNEDEPDARGIWARLRQRYRGADSVVLATTFSVSTALVAAAELGTARTPSERRGNRALPGTSRIAWRRRIAAEGYAWLLAYKGEGLTTKTWEYPPLESDFAQHFVDQLFGRLHRLSVVVRNEDEIVLAFCPSAESPLALSGLLFVAADTTLTRATWRLRTPKPEEEAGGEALFAPYDASGGLPILVPSRGLFWRTHAEGGYQQRWEVFDGWRRE